MPYTTEDPVTLAQSMDGHKKPHTSPPAAIMRLHLQGGASMNADQPLTQLICPVRCGGLMLGAAGSPFTADTGMTHAIKYKQPWRLQLWQ